MSWTSTVDKEPILWRRILLLILPPNSWPASTHWRLLSALGGGGGGGVANAVQDGDLPSQLWLPVNVECVSMYVVGGGGGRGAGCARACARACVYVCARVCVCVRATLRAPLSGTFLQRPTQFEFACVRAYLCGFVCVCARACVCVLGLRNWLEFAVSGSVHVLECFLFCFSITVVSVYYPCTLQAAVKPYDHHGFHIQSLTNSKRRLSRHPSSLEKKMS